jgi:hypothetical protein
MNGEWQNVASLRMLVMGTLIEIKRAHQHRRLPGTDEPSFVEAVASIYTNEDTLQATSFLRTVTHSNSRELIQEIRICLSFWKYSLLAAGECIGVFP